MAQQTAVEWLLQQIKNKNGKEFTSYYSEFIEQAKAMEKEQIMNAYSDGVFDGTLTDEFYEDTKVSGEQYYNETYNK
jgi:hypothetical protein